MNEKYERMTNEVTGMMNNFSFNPKEFCKAMTREHRTLQQTFTQLCLEWIKTCASEDYRHDGRNEYSHWISKEIATAYNNNHTETSVELFGDLHLPMI